MTTVTIARRFCGPPASGNGGYCAGVVAQAVPGCAEITLHHPPPLDTPMALIAQPDGARLVQGEQLIASARPGALALEPPAAPPLEQALRAQERFPGFAQHPFPTCFVCGPQRTVGDGLRIFSGALNGGDHFAATWQPGADLADVHGNIGARFVWAALDCPSYFALGDPTLVALLGRITGKITDTPNVGEPCVVVSWPIDHEGRKYRSGAAAYGHDQRLLGVGISTWIALRSDTTTSAQ